MSAVIDNNAIQAVFAQPAPDGTFESAMLSYLGSIGQKRQVLFLAFAPKAAGTFFRQAATYAINGGLFRFAHALGGRDGTPYLPNLLACYLDKDLPQLITHIHMQAFAANRHLLNAFGIRPIVMLRDIPDMLTSFWDMLDVDAAARADGLNCAVPENFVELSHTQKADFIVDAFTPWYASYFATWKRFADDMPDRVCVLRYSKFRQNPAEALHTALTHAGFGASHSDCKKASERAWSERNAFRFNKGTEGRGKKYFSPRHLAEISRKLSHYPELHDWMPDIMATRSHLQEASPFNSRSLLSVAYESRLAD